MWESVIFVRTRKEMTFKIFVYFFIVNVLHAAKIIKYVFNVCTICPAEFVLGFTRIVSFLSVFRLHSADLARSK